MNKYEIHKLVEEYYEFLEDVEERRNEIKRDEYYREDGVFHSLDMVEEYQIDVVDVREWVNIKNERFFHSFKRAGLPENCSVMFWVQGTPMKLEIESRPKHVPSKVEGKVYGVTLIDM